jgi:trans-2,3-dihydro-3-hydroxyanthranilate isomerase
VAGNEPDPSEASDRESYRYFICDVFTSIRFGGNQLAVLPEAEGLSDRQMQQIAREFNFSESAFVLPAEQGHTRRVRIFTPTAEVPFAGHPNIGTAFVLATVGSFGPIDPTITVTFEEKAGLVPITIGRRSGTVWCELSAPERLSLGKTMSRESVASAVSLAADDVVTTTHLPQVASVGLPFLIAELKDRAALTRARVNAPGFDALAAQGVIPDVHLYTKSADEFDLRTRMFAPFDGVPEDPATGSANCALAGLLRHHGDAADGAVSWRIAQGVEMGRPSILEAQAEKRGGSVVGTRIGGASVLVSEGVIHIA